ncbi:hypothetical protein SLS60_008764 [Paraconiothyrium brasiliense]|uniref:Heterokaryon incompatibility domain-containing protein n=1 Tax=Paraconiothyrium brasiliense TaxID=300254 RepID=A0ABR3QYE4_9PLEO
MTPATFKEAPQYDALSYTWGESKRSKWIVVNGKRMTIRENLWHALHSIRRKDVAQVMWVDAICINQADAGEKSSQVPLMSFTYSRARQVLLWLGQHKPPRWIENSIPVQWHDAFGVTHANKYPGPVKYWIYRLVHQEYWKRAWIVQEIGMASSISVYFGNQFISWTEFIKLVLWYDSRVDDPTVRHVFALEELRESRYRNGGAYALQHLLNSFSDNFCSVVHDKLYAFFSMSNDDIDDNLVIDYRRSVEEVYGDFVVAQNVSASDAINKQIDMVHFAGLVRALLTREANSRPKDLQYWGAMNDPETFLYDGCGDDRLWMCVGDKSGNTTMNLFALDMMRFAGQWMKSFFVSPASDVYHFWKDPVQEDFESWNPERLALTGNIQLRGIIVSRIRAIGPSHADYIGYPNSLKRWAAALPAFYPNETDLRRAIGQAERVRAILGSTADQVVRHVVALNGGTSGDPHLFVGTRLTTGIVPSTALEGDLICQFLGSDAAAVLREGVNGIPELVGRAAMIGEGNELQWERPGDRIPFHNDSEDVVTIGVDLRQLTALSLDVVVLPGTGDPVEDAFPL